MIAQIKLLQSACNNYSIAPEEHFGAWFRAMERLSEAERCACAGAGRGCGGLCCASLVGTGLALGVRTSAAGRLREGGLGAPPRGLTAAPLSCSYSLSCELEPPSESASNTLKAKKNAAIVKRWSE